eukprot:1972397-Pyramimonas_sp.AAC.1
MVAAILRGGWVMAPKTLDRLGKAAQGVVIKYRPAVYKPVHLWISPEFKKDRPALASMVQRMATSVPLGKWKIIPGNTPVLFHA